MYANARSRVRVGEGFSKEFEVKVGVHQGSVLSPLLFIIVLEALSREFRAGVPWEVLYADDLVIIADSLEECVRRLLIWKEAMEKKGLRVNAGKTKVMICGTGLDLLQSSGEYPCAVCRTGVGNNSIYCNGCKLWVHKKCSGLQRLTPNPDYRCARCMENARPTDSRPQSEVQIGPDKLGGSFPGFYTKLIVWGSLGLNFEYDGGPIIEIGGPIFLDKLRILEGSTSFHEGSVLSPGQLF